MVATALCPAGGIEAALFRDYSINVYKSEMIAVNWLVPQERPINIGDGLIRYAMIRKREESPAGKKTTYWWVPLRCVVLTLDRSLSDDCNDTRSA